MTQEEVGFWKTELELQKDLIRTRYESWQKIMGQYHMVFELPRLAKNKTVPFSRMYPLMRQLIAGALFRNPRMLINAKPLVETGTTDLSDISRRLERAGNEALSRMGAHKEVRQAFFNAAFTGVGVLRIGVTPQEGSLDIGFTGSSTVVRDFPYVSCRESFNFFVDPLCSPSGLKTARYGGERMLVSRNKLLKNPRFFDKHKEIEGIKNSETSDIDIFLCNAHEKEAVKKSIENGQFLSVFEVHDNEGQRLITFLEGLDEPLEEIDHPFIAGEPVMAPDPVTGMPMAVDWQPYDPAESILVSGLPYIILRLDIDSTFFPMPSMERIRHLELVMVESLSRRVNILRRFVRAAAIRRDELGEDAAGMKKKFDELEDGDVLDLNDENAIRPLEWGNVSPDQLGVESDARGYEEQSLHISDSGAVNASSATSAGLAGAQTGLNREWIKDRVGDVYKELTENNFRVFRDPRFTPEQFIVNLGPSEQNVNYLALTQQDFFYEYNIDVDAVSMQPLLEQVERDDAILLFDRLVASPNADRLELDKMLIRSGRARSVERLLKGKAVADAARLAQMENMVYIVRGQDPGIVEGMDHAAHLSYHTQEQLGQMQEFKQLLPEQQQNILKVLQQHISQHEQGIQMQSIGGGGSQPKVDARLTKGKQETLQSVIKGNAQRTANAATSGIQVAEGQL